jgi:hypothetical protein
LICSQKARRGRRKYGTYTLDPGKRKRSSISIVDEDGPSHSEGKDTVKSSTDSYAVPAEKEAKVRRQDGVTVRMASPSSAEAARTLLDLPDEPPTTSKPPTENPAATPEASKVLEDITPVCAREENGADSPGKAMVVTKEMVVAGPVVETDVKMVDPAPVTCPKKCSSQGVTLTNGRPDGAVTRLSYIDNHRLPLPSSRTSSRRENEKSKTLAIVSAEGLVNWGTTEEKRLSEAFKVPDVLHMDEELEARNIGLTKDSVQGSKSEGVATGAKKRKGGVPRRVPPEQDGVQTSMEDIKKEITQGPEGTDPVTAIVKSITPEKKEYLPVIQDTLSGKMTAIVPVKEVDTSVARIPPITQILKAISYSNNVTQDKHDVSVLFKASRVVFSLMVIGS